MTWRGVWQQLGIYPDGVVAVVIATTLLYCLFTLILHSAGPRLTAAGSTTSIALLTVLGSLCARAMLGNSPTLFGALVALLTLFTLEALFGRGRAAFTRLSTHRGKSVHRATGRASVVMVDGEPIMANLRRCHLTQDRLLARLRVGGLRHIEDAAVVIAEARGSLTLVRRGETIDADLLVGVRDAHLVPALYTTDARP